MCNVGSMFDDMNIVIVKLPRCFSRLSVRLQFCRREGDVEDLDSEKNPLTTSFVFACLKRQRKKSSPHPVNI